MRRRSCRIDSTTAAVLRALGLLPRATKRLARKTLFDLVDRFPVHASVPRQIHEEIEALKELHAAGASNYLLFRMAADRCYVTMELILRMRAKEQQIIRPRARTLERFCRWARDLGLFEGQGNRVSEHALCDLRNSASHPDYTARQPPDHSADSINDVIELANRLWGQDTIGGRLYGHPPTYRAFCRGWMTSHPMTSVTLPLAVDVELDPAHFQQFDEWLVLYAADIGGEAGRYVDGFECTAFPVRRIWQGNDFRKAVKEWRSATREGQSMPRFLWRDRLFIFRCGANHVERPRSPVHFRALAADARDTPGTHWRVVCADHPGPAYEGLVRLNAGDYGPGPLAFNLWQDRFQSWRELHTLLKTVKAYERCPLEWNGGLVKSRHFDRVGAASWETDLPTIAQVYSGRPYHLGRRQVSCSLSAGSELAV